MTGFGFSGRYKLKKTDEFSSVFNFRRRISGALLIMYYMPNALDHARLGVIVRKKEARRAAQRNYMKRVLRELFRHQQSRLGAVDILLRPQKLFTQLDYAQIIIEFQQLINKLRDRTGSRQT